ncbi:MAG TPA: peptidylprolyl isomerase [Burkholderiales bacterium]|nr:peptidylprolyl isomerase [Burkholderiales bacterium]
MRIERDTVVALQYELFNSEGALIEKTSAPIEYLHGGHHGIFERIEQALQGKQTGDTCDVYLQPVDAFGEYDAELVYVEPRSKLPGDIEIGMRFRGVPEGGRDGLIYTVTDIADDKVVLDGNHPLAGKALRFKCTVAAVRSATADEVAHGHVHGPHGHHH